MADNLTNGKDCYLNISVDDTQCNASTGNENKNVDNNNSLAIYFWIPLVLLMLSTCLTNLAVMFCTRIEKKMRTLTNMYVGSLAGADFAMGVGVYWGLLFYTIYGYWPFGRVMCSIWISLDFMLTDVSMFHLILIAHDRYVALVRPLEYRNKTSRRVLFLIALCWVGGIVLWVPAVVIIRHTGNTTSLDSEDCLFVPHPTYVVIQSIIAYYAPILIMVYFYAMCLHTLRKRAKVKVGSEITYPQNNDVSNAKTLTSDMSVRDVTTNDQSGPSTITGSNEQQQNGQQQLAAKKKKGQLELRIIRTFGIVIFVFLFLWIPWCFFWPITAYCESCIPFRLYVYSYWGAYLNSTINPFLYFMFNKDFRHAFKVLMSYIFKCYKVK